MMLPYKSYYNRPSYEERLKELDDKKKQILILKAKKKLGKQRGADLKAKNQFNKYC